MPPKKVAKRKPRKPVPLVNQNQRNRQETKVTVNLAGFKGKAKAKPRRKGVARVAQPTSNIVNVSPSFAQPSFAPQPYFAPPIGASAGFGLSAPPATESLGVPITLGDGELGVPTFGGDARESIGARNDPMTTVRAKMPDIIVQRPTQQESQRSFATPIESGRFKLSDENVDGVFNVDDLYSVGETEFLFSNELDPPLNPFGPMTRDVLSGGRAMSGAKRGGAMSDSDSSKSARGFNVIPSEERATVGRRMTPISEKNIRFQSRVCQFSLV